MLGYLYWTIHRNKENEVIFAKGLCTAIVVGGIVSVSLELFEGVVKFVLFYFGIIIDAGWQILIREKLNSRPIDRVHLIERIGLLAIFSLDESVIAMV